MKTHHFIMMLAVWLSGSLIAQNVGIGTTTPQEKLQVDGKIFTSQGGIKFPDNTVQVTAAYNQNPESVAIPRGIGFMKFLSAPTLLKGPLDTIGLTQVSLVYAYNHVLEGSGAQVALQAFELTKQIDKITPGLFSYLATGNGNLDVEVYLTRENAMGDLEVYMILELDGVFITSHRPSLYPGVGGYAHTETVGFFMERLTIRHLGPNQCFCWDFTANQSCGC